MDVHLDVSGQIDVSTWRGTSGFDVVTTVTTGTAVIPTTFSLMPTATGGLVVDTNPQLGTTSGTLNAADLVEIVALAAQIRIDQELDEYAANVALLDKFEAAAGQAVFDFQPA